MFQPLFVRSLSEEEKTQLAARSSAPAREESWRAAVILRSAEGESAADIGRALGFHPSNVKKWIRKFNQEGIAGIAPRKRGPREGPRPRFSREDIGRLLDLAASDPGSLGLGFEKWTAQKLANVAVERGIVERISHVTVRQVLKRNLPTAAPNDSEEVPGLDQLEQAAAPLAAGKMALADSDYERAAAHLGKALEERPGTSEEEAEIRILLSQALEELSRFEDAYAVIGKYDDQQALSSLSARTRAYAKLRVGWVHSWLRHHVKAIALLNDAKKILLELQDERGICETNHALGRAYVGINEFRIARDYLLAAAGAESTSVDRELLARIYLQLGVVDYYEGSFRSSKEAYLKGLELAEGSVNTNLTGMVLLNLGSSADDDNPAERKESADFNRRAITLLERTSHRDAPLAYNNLGDNLRLFGLWTEAIECLNKAIDIAQRFKQANHEATGRATLAEILALMGRFSEAEGHATKCIELTEAAGDRWLEAYGLRALATIHRSTGRIETALNVLRQALRISTSLGDLHGLTLAQVGLAETHFLQGGYDQAGEYLELAQGRLKEEKSKSLLITGSVQRLAGQLEAVGGRHAAGRQHIAQSISIFTTTEIPYELGRSHYAMGLLLFQMREMPAAETHIKQAAEIFQTLGAQPDFDLATNVLSGIAAGWAQAPAGAMRASAGVFPSNWLVPAENDGSTARATLGSQESSGPGRPIETPVQPSDVLLMQRLIEASASHELLLQELASVIYENFPVEAVIVFRTEDNMRFDPLVVQGIVLEQAEIVCKEIDPSVVESGGRVGLECVTRLASGREDNRLGRTAPTIVWVKVSVDADPAQTFAGLQPLLKQAELGMEICSLRSAARMPAVPAYDHRIQTVMPGFIVGSSSMFDVLEKIHKIRTSDVTVLITGESGTGKELVARAIHGESARARAIFLPFNCTATSKDLIDSQLFGHRRGAFTGATANYPGIIKAAEGGTLFLDEIGDVALEVQPKLMRFLQEGEIQPLGETKPLRVDVRVLAATNSDLERAVDEGRFREDLFHRLNIIRIHVPPLRDRAEEVPVLAQHFLDHFSVRSGKQGIKFTQDSIDALTEYDWPGNVRQLRNEIERVVAYGSEGLRVRVQDLSPEVTRSRAAQSERPPLSRAYTGNGDGDDGAGARHRSSDRNLSGSSHKGQPIVKLKEATAELERRLIGDALARNRHNLSRTASDLGLSRRGLRLKLAQLGIERERPG
jgi:hydrogenase-4 transcriptional activator